MYGYKVTIFTDHAPDTHLFKSKNLQGRLARWFLTIEEFCPEIRHVPGRANVVADSLSRNIAVVATSPPPMKNFSSTGLTKAQREHGLWRHVIYALESGDETTLPLLPVPFSQSFLSPDKILCRTWSNKKHQVNQIVIPDSLVPIVLRMVHDAVIARNARLLRLEPSTFGLPCVLILTSMWLNVSNAHSLKVLILARHLFWSILHLTDHGTLFP